MHFASLNNEAQPDNRRRESRRETKFKLTKYSKQTKEVILTWLTHGQRYKNLPLCTLKCFLRVDSLDFCLESRGLYISRG